MKLLLFILSALSAVASRLRSCPSGCLRQAISLRSVLRFKIRTANSAAAVAEELVLSPAAQTVNAALPETPENGWYLVTPYGDFPEPGGEYTQSFHEAEGAEVVRSWNSIGGKAFRVIKNVRHKLKPTTTMPVFFAPPGGLHPDVDHADWRKLTELARVHDLRTCNAGLEAWIEWDAAGMAHRGAGPLRPSVNWWHEIPDASGRVYPAHIESITLTRTPNIATVPAWTANTLAGVPAAETKPNENMNHRDQLIALLGLKSDATDSAIQSSLDAHGAKVTANASALSTANAAKADLETQLGTANGQVTTLTSDLDLIKTANTGLVAERTTLQTANAALTTQVGTLVKGLLDLAEKKGAITPGERATYETRLTTANTAADALKELPARKALNTEPVQINGNRVDLSTANARQDALSAAVNKRMKDDGIDYDTAFSRVKADPAFKPLFEAMANPAK